jgi:replicative DNA helicase
VIAARGNPVLIFSQEMPRRQWLMRNAQRIGGRWFHTLPDGDARDALSPFEYAQVRAQLATLPYLFANVKGLVSMEQIEECIDFAVRRYDVMDVIIDHLGKIAAPDPYAPDWKQIDQICGGLQTLAHDLKPSIFLLAHTNKPKEENALPKLYDARGSAGIVQNSAAVWGVWRDREIKPEPGVPRRGGISKLGVLKGRDPHGEEDVWVELWFDRMTQSYAPYGSAAEPIMIQQRTFADDLDEEVSDGGEAERDADEDWIPSPAEF